VPAVGGLYNGMIAPVNPYSIRGVLWFQGEANTSDPDYYAQMFPGLIRSWRAAWRQGDFPFLFVQLAPFGEIVEQPQDSDWARLREAQLLTSLTVPNTFMAVITDWGHETDIHTKPKQPVGERLATLARAKVYGEKIVGEGPLLRSAAYTGGKALLSFANIGRGLEARKMAREDITTDRGSKKAGGALHAKANTDNSPVPLAGFAIAGADGKFVNATAVIDGENVVVSSPQVAEPTQVRYGWADYPTGNLFNKDGFPATPFRTDGPPLNLDPPKSPPKPQPQRQSRPSR
jgi:sialate O-acetylesterase